MKTINSKRFTGFLAAVLTATAAFRSPADEATTASKIDKIHTGTVLAIDPKEHTLSVTTWWSSHRNFNLGDACSYVQLDNPKSTINDLRPGERVEVNYQRVHGVLIADQVRQLPMQYEGKVMAINPSTHQLTLREMGRDKHLQLAGDCNVILLHQRTGALDDIRPGDHVTVTYEKPGDVITAREIAQTSMEFAGAVTAIDLEDQTVKARTTFETKKFNLADNCSIVVNGRVDGKLSDLRPNEKLTFTYDEINGINVVNRIGEAKVPTNSVAYSQPMTY